MWSWVNRLAIVMGLATGGSAVAQPGMPEPPVPVVERTVTIRLLDPEGEPLEGVPIWIRTPFQVWRGMTLTEVNRERASRGQALIVAEYSGQPPRHLTDEDGVLRARVEFFEGDWRFIATYFPLFDTVDIDKYPGYSFSRLREYSKRVRFPYEWNFKNSIDPERTVFEIRLDPAIEVRLTVLASPRVEIDKIAINLYDASPPGPIALMGPQGMLTPAQGSIGPLDESEASAHRSESMQAIPGRDHMLTMQLDAFTHLCWLIPGSAMVAEADLGEFRFALAPATALPGLRVFPKRIDECTGLAEPNPDDLTGYIGITLLALDGSFYVNRGLSPENNHRWAIMKPGDDAWNLDVFVPPGDYYIIDGSPALRGPQHDFLVELLRGNPPEPGEIPMLTVKEGTNPYTPIESADLHNALKAWHDKRFPKAEVPWRE